MRRKLLAVLLCFAAAVTVSCGADAEGTQAEEETAGTEAANGARSAQMEIDLEKQVVKLCDYKEIDVTITGDYEVTDGDVEQNMLQLLSYSGAGTVEVTDRDTVQDGDYVKIDYSGYKDDVAFEGGTATDVMMDVSNNRDVMSGSNYIDGFCDDLVGAKVGEEVDTHVTFPENYQAEELAGQPAVFKITVKGIYEPVTMDTLTDGMVADTFSGQGIETKEKLLDTVREVLENQMDSYKSQETMDAVKTYVLEHSEVEIPEDYMEARMAELEYNATVENCADGQTMEEFLEANGTTLEAQRESWRTYLDEQIRLEFLFGRIAELEGIEVDEDEFSSYVDYLVQSDSDRFSTQEDVYDYYGVGHADEGERALRGLYRAQRAMSFVAKNANVTVEPDTESPEGTE